MTWPIYGLIACKEPENIIGKAKGGHALGQGTTKVWEDSKHSWEAGKG